MSIPLASLPGFRRPTHAAPPLPPGTAGPIPMLRFATPAGSLADRRPQAAPPGATTPALAAASRLLLPHSSPSLIHLTADKARLERITALVSNPASDKNEILRVFAELSEGVRTKIYESLWKDHGHPDQYDYAKILIDNNPFLLGSHSAPFIHSSGGSLIQQMNQSIHLRITEEESTASIAIFENLRKLIHEGANNDVLKRHFLTLPESIRNELYGQVYHSSSDRAAADDWGKRTLLGNIRRLVTLRDSSLPGENLLVQRIGIIQSSIPEKKRAEQKALFLALYASNKLNHFELKRLFEALPLDIQAHGDMPKPPFYGKGVKTDLYHTYGAHRQDGRTLFRVYAPNAKEISLVLRPSEPWQAETKIAMTKGVGGIWEANTEAPVGTKYQYLIKGQDDIVRRKADPYAKDSAQEYFEAEGTGGYSKQHVSLVTDTHFAWTDSEAIARRNSDKDAPATIYEVHATSWKKKPDGTTMNWRELATELAAYCKEMHYTHVELVGAMDHPDERSWGYQPTGFFTPNSHLGSTQDFKFFVDYMHSQGLKVLIDWVPGHFAIDSFAFRQFDGSCLYEHSDKKRNFQHEWDVYMFDYEKRSVRDFLISSAHYWVDELHIDGLRIDAVTAILHTDIGRKRHADGSTDYLPHHKGKRSWTGAVHSDAKTFLKDLNTLLHDARHHGIVTHAEESGGFPHLTSPVFVKNTEHRFSTRGLGFDAKWNMGRVTLTLNEYFRRDPYGRDLSRLTDGMSVDHAEYVIDVTSHDECANGKGSLRGGMFGATELEKFAQTRLDLSRKICAPGMKLTMMGCEIAQHEEWSGRLARTLDDEPGKPAKEPGISAFDWGALGFAPCRQVQQMVKELNRLYLDHPVLSASGNKGSDFQWIDNSDITNHVISYHRTSKDGTKRVACIHNFGSKSFETYDITLPPASSDELVTRIRSLREIFNSDAERYGGEGRTNDGATLSVINDAVGVPVKIRLRLPAFATVILEETID